MCQSRGGAVGSQKATCWGLRESKGWDLETTSVCLGQPRDALQDGEQEKSLGGSNPGKALLLLLIRFVSWGKWPHHSERLSFFKGRVLWNLKQIQFGSFL